MAPIPEGDLKSTNLTQSSAAYNIHHSKISCIFIRKTNRRNFTRGESMGRKCDFCFLEVSDVEVFRVNKLRNCAKT